MAIDPNWISTGANVIVILGGATVGLYKFRRIVDRMVDRVESMGKQVDKNTDNISKHTGDPAPHQSCRDHTLKMDQFGKTLDEVKLDVSTLDSRLYDMLVSGKKPVNGHNGSNSGG